MNEQKYLRLTNKLAYGCGDMACNFCYSFVASFVLIYLTNTVGLNAGIVGTLMLISRVLDGFTDVLFGSLIDNTKTRLGRARPWLLYTILPMIVCEILLFTTPSMGQSLQYVYFFVIYTILNDVLYTACNIAYSTLSVLATRNKNEQVQLGVFRFLFTMVTAIVVSGGTMSFVEKLGGGVQGWRTMAILYSIGFGVSMLLCVLGVKELPEEAAQRQEKSNLLQNIRYLLRNPFYLRLLAVTIIGQALTNIGVSVGSYYTTYVLGDSSKLMLFTLTQMLPMVIGLAVTPALVNKYGIWKSNLIGLLLSALAALPYMIFGYRSVLWAMLAFNALRWLGMAPMSGSAAALTAELCRYTMMHEGKDVVGSMFSCSSMGNKIGAGIGSAVCGWLLELGHFDGMAAVQPESALDMMKFMYAALPFILGLVMAVIYFFLDVEKANAKALAENKL